MSIEVDTGSKIKSFRREIFTIAEKCNNAYDLTNEESVKTSLVLPFIRALGYDIHNNEEVKPEYRTDLLDKREKVDYAICKDGKAIILIEVKAIGNLSKRTYSQLARYFNIERDVRIGIATDGIRYKFFTDSNEHPNIMNEEPYMEIDLLDLTREDLQNLVRYRKNIINADAIAFEVKNEKLKTKMRETIENMLSFNIDDWILNKMAFESGIGIHETFNMKRLFNRELFKILREIGIDRQTITKMKEKRQNEENNNKSENEQQREETNESTQQPKTISELAATKDFEAIKINNINKFRTKENNGFKRAVESIDLGKLYNVDEVNVYGHRLEYAIIFNKLYENISFAGVWYELMNTLAREDREMLEYLESDPYFETQGKDRITRDVSKVSKPRQLDGTDIYIETHLGGPDLMKLVIAVLDKCGLSKQSVRLKFRK